MIRTMLLAAAVLVAAPAAAETAHPVLERVQKDVNYRVHFVPEKGRKDEWKIATTQGDCEDIALAKREELIARGWDAADLQIIILRMLDGTGHAVLSVKSLGLILDNEPMFKDFVITWQTYRKVTGAKVYCVAQNLTLGQMEAHKRCKPPVVAANGKE